MAGALPTPRYVVTELEGYGGPGITHSRVRPGLSCHVIDRWYARRVIATFRSEELVRAPKPGMPHRLESRGHRRARAAAAAYARRLNES